MNKNAISSIVIIVLVIGAIVYGNRLHDATTELEAIKNGFVLLLCGIYMMGIGIVTRLENKD